MAKGKWSEAQKRYSHSELGRQARRRYQTSIKGIETRKRYLEKRKTRLAELKLKQAEEVKPVAKEAKVDKIRKEARLKK